MKEKERIIERILELRMTTEEIGDILGKTGVLKGIHSVNDGQYAAGEIQYICAYNNSNWPVHEQLIDLQSGKICFIDTCFVDDYAIFGELVSSYILDKKKAKAIIINGLVRDIAGIRSKSYPVWCSGVTPIGCFNVRVNLNPEIQRHIQNGRSLYDGSIAVCDDSGVIIIPKEEIKSDFIERIDFMRKQEKIWFDCVLNRNWNTYDTVCLKKYVNHTMGGRGKDSGYWGRHQSASSNTDSKKFRLLCYSRKR